MADTLLLADGNPTIQRIVTMTFAGQGFTVVTVNDGDEAIAAITAERPDIVLADVSMPKVSGYDVAAFVKQRPELAHIPVLLMAGALEPVDQARANAVKCDGVLVKPFEPQQVVTRVRELVRSGKGHPSQTIAGVPRPIARLVESHPKPVARVEPTPAKPADVTTGRQRPNAPDPLADYFDRLDVAFGASTPPPANPVAADGQGGEADRHDLPTLSSVLGDFSRDPVPAPPRPHNPFAALVAADRQARQEEKARAEAAAKATVPAIDDAQIEAIATRVLERLAPHGVTDLVSRVVADVAERLVREEIARIRGGK